MLEVLDNNCCRVLGIDPGNSTLGLAILDIDFTTKKISLVDAATIDAGRLLVSNHHYFRYKSERAYKQKVLSERIKLVLYDYAPTYVGVETPFMYVRPQAFEALVELFLLIGKTVEEYDVTTPIVKITPRNAKKAVGLLKAEDAKDKDAVRKALLQLDIVNKEMIHQLDEHSVDAIAVGYSVCINLLKGVVYV